MSTNIDPRRDFTDADRQLVRPKIEFNALLKIAGATKDILSMREVMYYLGQYIMKKQLYDQTQQHIVHCSQDMLGTVLGVESFSVKEPGPLFQMIMKNLVPVRTIQEPPNAPLLHSHSQLARPPEVKIQESCLATQQQNLSQPVRPPDGPPDRPPEDNADSDHSTSGSRRRRRSEVSEPGTSHCDNDGGEEDDSDGERKRRRGDNYSVTFDNSRSWYVVEDLRNEQDRVRHDSQSSEAHSYVSNRSDRSDRFSVEFEVESIDSDDGDNDLDEDTSLSDDDQVYEVTVYEDDDTDTDTEITEADYWRCLKCDELNPPLPRNCNRCWSLRQDWLRDVYPNNPYLSINPSPLAPKPSPGPDKSTSAEHPGVEEEGVDVPDGRRATPIPPSSVSPSAKESSQTYSQASTISHSSSQGPPRAIPCAPSSSVPPAADPGSDLCVICQSEPKDGCIVHGKTGHLMACFRCARKLKKRNKLCPVCREPIQQVVKTFFS